MNGKTKSKKDENPEFDRVKDVFKKILAVPKENVDEIKKRQSRKPHQNLIEQDCN